MPKDDPNETKPPPDDAESGDAEDQSPAAEAGGVRGGGNGNGNGTDSDDDEPVGYGRPPKRYWFKPGQSGNPKGRRKGARGMKAMLRQELNAKVRVTENGKSRRITKMELMIKQLTARGAKGDFKSIAKLIDLGGHVFGMEDPVDSSAPLSPGDQAIIDALRARREASHNRAKKDFNPEDDAGDKEPDND